MYSEVQKIAEVDLKDRDEAKEWIARNQLGRRNLNVMHSGTIEVIVLERPLCRRNGWFCFRRFFPRACCRSSSARTENGSATFSVAEPPSFRSSSSIRRLQLSLQCHDQLDEPIDIDPALANIFP